MCTSMFVCKKVLTVDWDLLQKGRRDAYPLSTPRVLQQYVCMYVCMYVCQAGWRAVQVYVCMFECMSIYLMEDACMPFKHS